MRAHYFQHEPFEDLAAMEPWLRKGDFQITCTRLFEDPSFPSVDEIDWLIMMGGTMSVNDEKELPWLVPEKEFVRRAVAAGKVVIGVCLGAQMIASALGAKVYRNREKEIGWYPLKKAPGITSGPFADFPDHIHVFHWHGETFDLPKGARAIAASEATKNQIFTLGDNVIGFQCHLETTAASLASLSAACAAELIPAAHVQTHEEMKTSAAKFAAPMHDALFRVLEKLKR